MRLLLTLIGNDLRRRLASPAGILLSLAIPLAMAGSMALAFGQRGGEPTVPKLEIVVVDLDDSPLSSFLAGAGQNAEAAKYISTFRAATPEKGLDLMRSQGHHAMLVIPTGFMDAVLEGRSVELPLVKNPAKRVMPVVAQQGLEIVALYGSVGARLLPADGAAKVRSLLEGEGWDDAVGIAALITDTYIRAKNAGALLFPPIIEVDRVREQAARPAGEGRQGGFDFIAWMYPGMIVMALLFVALNQMKDLLAEQQAGTLRRLLAGPVSVAPFLLSKVISVGIGVAASLAILIAAGSLFFGVDWGPWGPLAAASVALTLASTGFGAMVYSLSRTQNQGDAFGTILVILMSLLGGAFLPPQILPGFVRGASKFTLNYWGNESFRVLTAGGGWPELGAHLPILSGMALISVTLGTLLLRHRHLRGAV
jgi:ABC-type multidrug transport system permease subunit